MKRFIILLIFMIVAVVGAILIYNEGTLPINKADESTKIFVIRPGQSVNEIVKNLALEGLIRNRLVFYLIIKKQNAEKNLQAGDFRLSPSMDAFKIVKTLQHGTLDSWITVVEGLRKEEIAQIVARQFQIPEIEFIKTAPEGYLFPDTYLLPVQATNEMIIDIMQKNFEKKYSPLREKAKKLNLTDNQVVTLASLVEREARSNEDKVIVAGVIMNRLKIGMKLDLDATVQYALGYQSDQKSWWKKDLTKEDLEIDSPYNTYNNAGLPPGPICNPGFASLEAVVKADGTSPYLYYLSDKNGKMHYAKTLEEHEENIRKYLP